MLCRSATFQPFNLSTFQGVKQSYGNQSREPQHLARPVPEDGDWRLQRRRSGAQERVQAHQDQQPCPSPEREHEVDFPRGGPGDQERLHEGAFRERRGHGRNQQDPQGAGAGARRDGTEGTGRAFAQAAVAPADPRHHRPQRQCHQRRPRRTRAEGVQDVGADLRDQPDHAAQPRTTPPRGERLRPPHHDGVGGNREFPENHRGRCVGGRRRGPPRDAENDPRAARRDRREGEGQPQGRGELRPGIHDRKRAEDPVRELQERARDHPDARRGVSPPGRLRSA